MSGKVETYLIKNKNAAEPALAEMWQRLEKYYIKR